LAFAVSITWASVNVLDPAVSVAWAKVLRGTVANAMQSEPIALQRMKEDLRIEGTFNSTSGKIFPIGLNHIIELR
jgi:hypothetical protein